MQIVLQTINDWAIAVQVVLTTALVLITLFYMLLTRSLAKTSRAQAKSMTDSIDEMRKTREAQARAYVTLELWPWDRNFNMFDLAIRNYGSGAAREISFQFDHEIHRAAHGGTLNGLELMRDLPFLAPHDVVLTFVGNRNHLRHPEAKLEDWTGTVRFTDDVGTHEARFRVNLKVFDNMPWPYPGGEPPGAPNIRPGYGRTGPQPEFKPARWKDGLP